MPEYEDWLIDLPDDVDDLKLRVQSLEDDRERVKVGWFLAKVVGGFLGLVATIVAAVFAVLAYLAATGA